MSIADRLDFETRKKNGIFFTRPEMVNELASCISWSSVGTIIDSAAGSGRFLFPLAERFPDKTFFGIEKHSGIYQEASKKGVSNVLYFHGDAVLDSFPIPPCDLYLGNPPFINFSDLDADYRQQLVPFWKKAFPVARGFRLLLGTSRGDLAQLIFGVTVDRYLKPGGQMAVILPDSLIHGNEAGAAFRSFPGITVEKLVDLSGRDAFDYTARDSFYLCGKKGGKTQFPVEYLRGTKKRPLFFEDGQLVERLVSSRGCAYKARQGINTLGANGVFFFKKNPPFSSPLIRPLLKSSDVTPWNSVPSYSALIPYEEGKLIPEERLQAEFPREYSYLLGHKELLLSRKSRFARKHWYGLFGIGPYTFGRWKVVWRALGAQKLEAAVISEAFPNQAMHCFFSVETEEEALFLCGILNTESCNRKLLVLNKAGSRSFAQPSTIGRLPIPLYDRENTLHQHICLESKRRAADSEYSTEDLERSVTFLMGKLHD